LLTDKRWESAKNTDLIKAGTRLPVPDFLFSKIEDAEMEQQIQKLLDTKKANQAANQTAKPQKPHIEYDDFDKMDIRVGTILAAEKVAKTKKLLKLLIDTGIDKRTVVSGIAEYYQPEDIIGQQVSILVNLAPKELKGIQSQGMILMAQEADGTLRFVVPQQITKPGSEIK
jgi:methionyl-tRNA synthetase